MNILHKASFLEQRSDAEESSASIDLKIMREDSCPESTNVITVHILDKFRFDSCWIIRRHSAIRLTLAIFLSIFSPPSLHWFNLNWPRPLFTHADTIAM